MHDKKPNRPVSKRIGRPLTGKISQEDMAAKAGVAAKTLREWARNEGIDWQDEAAVMARAEASKHRDSKSEASGDSRQRKLDAEADILEHKLAVLRGEYVSAGEMKNEGLRIAIAVKGVFLRMPDDLPPLLAGRTAAEVKKTVSKYVKEKLSELSTYQSPIKIEP